MGRRPIYLLGASSCSANSKASVDLPDGHTPGRRGGPYRFGRSIWYWHPSINTAGAAEIYQPVCGDSPDCSVTNACAEAPGAEAPGAEAPYAEARGNSGRSPVAPGEPAAPGGEPAGGRRTGLLSHRTEDPKTRRRPWPGRRRKPTSCLATKRAPSLSPRPTVTGLTWPDTPPAAGRAWVPGCRARTLLRPYPLSTTKSPAWKVPPRDQFVILISQPDHMPLTSGSPAVHPPAPAGRFAAAQNGWDGIQPTYTDSDRRLGRPQRAEVLLYENCYCRVANLRIDPSQRPPHML
jgi:hypothetical protein